MCTHMHAAPAMYMYNSYNGDIRDVAHTGVRLQTSHMHTYYSSELQSVMFM